MRQVFVAAGNIFTPLGSLEECWQALLAGKSAVLKSSCGRLAGEYPLAAIADLPGEFGSWQRLEGLLSRVLADIPKLPPATGLFLATTKGAVGELGREQRAGEGQPWQLGDWLGKKLEIPGETFVTSAACASSLIAVIQGAMAVAAGECDYALVIGFDLLSEFVVSGFASLHGLTATFPRPFDCRRDGLALGDGAGWLLLSGEESGKICLNGWGISCDATHITAPSREAVGLKAVLRQIGRQMGWHEPYPVGGINAHGTGTLFNDAMELRAFDELCQKATPLCSVKGALGHSLAASGLVEVVLSVKSLEEGVLPPTVGLELAESSSCVVSGSEALPLVGKSILTTNSGFGGINAGLLLGKN